jgi:fatty-acyl-CoA synthase
MSLLDRVSNDLRTARALVRIGATLRKARPGSSYTFVDAFHEGMAGNEDRPAILFEGRSASYREVDALSNRVGHWALDQGMRPGDVVALMAPNRLEYIPLWLGLTKAGVVTALINSNLTGAPLAHSIEVAGADHVIVDPELAPALQDAGAKGRPWLLEGGGSAGEDLQAALAEARDAALPAHVRRGFRAEDTMVYIYTSGTTGLPKAAKISHQRAITMATGGHVALEFGPGDVMYDCLPLYHSAGGMMAAGGALLSGATLAVSRKFSASRFIPECRETGATGFQYIGELCRYLLNSPVQERERDHQLRACIGNGLRPEVWEPFQQRFGIPKVLEFYGATEGTMSLMNLDGKPGAVGRMPAVIRKVLGIHLVKFDVAREEVVRDARGRCIECEPDEPGELIGRIGRGVRFEGYTNEEATRKKVLTDVFASGDQYFRSGDLLRADRDGWFYFVDRIGDTFRWKGENVATSEVAEVLSACVGVDEANVYGVEVPGADGRAGMAALVTSAGFELENVAARLESQLAAYARPLFLRLQPEMEVTGTFKHRKVELVKDGFDPSRVSDPIYFRDAEKGYVPFDAALHARLMAGELRV